MRSFAINTTKNLSGGARIIARKIKSLLRANPLYKDRYVKAYEKYISQKIAATIRKEIISKKQVYIVYDHSCSCLAYGEFFHHLMLARFFLTQNLKVSFLIIDGEYRTDFQDERAFSRAQQFLAEEIDFANFIAGAYRSNFLCKKVSWKEGNTELTQASLNESVYIYQHELVVQRLPIYHRSFNVVNHLVHGLDEDLTKKILLNSLELGNCWGKFDLLPKQPYLALNVRYNPDWSTQRNTTESLFVNAIKKLNSYYPNLSIIVVSDRLGCNYFMEVAQKHSIDCLFSKNLDLPESFISDVLLVLGAIKYFQINGGGLGSILIFSSTPFTIIAPIINEIMWTKRKLVSWQASDQVFKNFYYTGDDAQILLD